MSSTFTEYVVGDQDYSLQEFYANFSDDLPQVVCVTQGFCAEEDPEKTLDQGQILRINSIKREERVFGHIKTSSKTPYISIGYDSPEIFQLTSFTGEVISGTIRELIERYELPLELRKRQRPFSKADSTYTAIYQCQRIYDHIYLLANFLSKVRLFVEVQRIPIYIEEVKIAPVTGVKNFDNQVWDDFKEKLNVATKGIDFNLHHVKDFIFLDTDITVTPTLEDSLSGYCGISARISGDTHQYQNLTSDEASCNPHQLPRRSMHIYHSIDDLSLLQIDKEPETIVRRKFPTLKNIFSKKTDKDKTAISSPLEAIPKNTDKLSKVMTISEKKEIVKPALPLRSSFRCTHMQLETQMSSSTEAISRPDRERELHIEEVISKFSINDVGNVLVELGLEKFVESFQKAAIDGYTLTMLTKQILHEEFGLKQYEAIKLRNFVRKGHIPK